MGESENDAVGRVARKPRDIRRLGSDMWKVNVDPAYDQHITSDEYERIVGVTTRGNLGELIADELQRHLPNTESTSILEIAAGTGLTLKGMVSKGYTVTALDLSQELLNTLKERFPNIPTVQADMNTNLPFRENSFDGVTTAWANRFIEDTDIFLEEVRRVLRPGGVLVWPIFTPEMTLWKWRNGIKQPTRAKSLAIITKNAGFSEVDIIKPSLEQAQQTGVMPQKLPQFIIAKK